MLVYDSEGIQGFFFRKCGSAAPSSVQEME